MEASGTVIKREVQSGVSRSGKDWQKVNFVIEFREGTYTKHLAFDLFGDQKISDNPFSEGDVVSVSYDLESNEWNGRWFTVCNAYRVVPFDPSKAAPTYVAQPVPLAQAAQVNLSDDSALPF